MTNRILDVFADDIVVIEDGFRYFFTSRGAMSAADLRIIADELDRLNSTWDKQLAEELSKYPQCNTTKE
jgi:hypothetical protein